jgi:hypothetical protein
MRPFRFELANEGIEAILLLQAVEARRSGDPMPATVANRFWPIPRLAAAALNPAPMSFTPTGAEMFAQDCPGMCNLYSITTNHHDQARRHG